MLHKQRLKALSSFASTCTSASSSSSSPSHIPASSAASASSSLLAREHSPVAVTSSLELHEESITHVKSPLSFSSPLHRQPAAAAAALDKSKEVDQAQSKDQGKDKDKATKTAMSRKGGSRKKKARIRSSAENRDQPAISFKHGKAAEQTRSVCALAYLYSFIYSSVPVRCVPICLYACVAVAVCVCVQP